ncbi:MAG: glycosyltransferase family 9 protein [Planctomycetota bacterium]|jgi:heptosyltransferase-2
MNAVVLRSGALGDFVLTLPVLAALRRSSPGAELVYVGRDAFGELARLAGLADRVLSQDAPEVVALYSEAPDAGEALARAAGPVAYAVSFLGSDDVSRNLLRAGAGEVLSCSARPGAGADVHAADHLASVLRGRLDVPVPAVPRIEVPAAERERARALLREAGMPPGGYLVIHPGSGSLTKNWPVASYCEFARLAREATDLAVVVLLGPPELERDPSGAERIRAAADAGLESPPLPTLAGILAGAAAYVGNDSGVSHLAAACGAPTVAVFGPTDPAVWAPRGPRVRVVRDASGPAVRAGPTSGADAPGDLGRVEVASVLEALLDVTSGAR